MSDILGIVFVLGLLLFGVVVGVNELERAACHSRWEHSGFKSDYGFFKGCVIQLEDGTWIPADNYREIP